MRLQDLLGYSCTNTFVLALVYVMLITTQIGD